MTYSLVYSIYTIGDPQPSVTWWKEGRLIDSSWETGLDGSVHNTVQIGPLTRYGSIYLYIYLSIILYRLDHSPGIDNPCGESYSLYLSTYI